MTLTKIIFLFPKLRARASEHLSIPINKQESESTSQQVYYQEVYLQVHKALTLARSLINANLINDDFASVLPSAFTYALRHVGYFSSPFS